MNKLVTYANHLLADIAQFSGTQIGTLYDNALEWLLKEAPSLDKMLLQFLERGWDYQEFETLDSHLERSPVYLLWRKLQEDITENGFNSQSVGLSLKWLRQCLLFCYKAEFEPTEDQLHQSQKDFVEIDSNLDIFDQYYESSKDQVFFRTVRQLISRVIAKIDWLNIDPSHGPGAVFPSFVPSERSRFDTVYDSIEENYPFYEFFCGLPNYWPSASEVANDTHLTRAGDIVAKLVAVPKDSRGPRLICVHPREAIWIQQGHRRLLMNAIASNPLTSGKINFLDQGVNAGLASLASMDRSYCTIDLSEASDRISLSLVRDLFGHASKYIECCRAKHCQLLDGTVHTLRKAFPMGNASTFPMEALIFWAAVRAGIRCQCGENCTDIYVYGDDIIVPVKYHDAALRGLIRIGLKPNANKTFLRGFFRESCGMDAYSGVCVTPLRVRHWDVGSVPGKVSLCDLAKRARLQGFHSLSSALYTDIRRAMRAEGQILHLSNNVQGQGLYEYVDWSFDKLVRYQTTLRWSGTHTWLSPTFLVRSVLDTPREDAWWHLQDSLLRIARSDEDMRTEQAYALPRRTRLVRGWIQAIL